MLAEEEESRKSKEVLIWLIMANPKTVNQLPKPQASSQELTN